MKWLKSKKPMTETNRKLESYVLAAMFGASVGAFAVYAAVLIHTIFDQNSDNIGNRLIVFGLASAVMVALGACAAVFWVRDPNMSQKLLQQAKDEKKAQLEATS